MYNLLGEHTSNIHTIQYSSKTQYEKQILEYQGSIPLKLRPVDVKEPYKEI